MVNDPSASTPPPPSTPAYDPITRHFEAALAEALAAPWDLPLSGLRPVEEDRAQRLARAAAAKEFMARVEAVDPAQLARHGEMLGDRLAGFRAGMEGIGPSLTAMAFEDAILPFARDAYAAGHLSRASHDFIARIVETSQERIAYIGDLHDILMKMLKAPWTGQGPDDRRERAEVTRDFFDMLQLLEADDPRRFTENTQVLGDVLGRAGSGALGVEMSNNAAAFQASVIDGASKLFHGGKMARPMLEAVALIMATADHRAEFHARQRREVDERIAPYAEPMKRSFAEAERARSAMLLEQHLRDQQAGTLEQKIVPRQREARELREEERWRKIHGHWMNADPAELPLDDTERAAIGSASQVRVLDLTPLRDRERLRLWGYLTGEPFKRDFPDATVMEVTLGSCDYQLIVNGPSIDQLYSHMRSYFRGSLMYGTRSFDDKGPAHS